MKGYTIDCNYIIPVKKIMQTLRLPRPRRKQYLQGDGETLPIILYTVKGWDI